MMSWTELLSISAPRIAFSTGSNRSERVDLDDGLDGGGQGPLGVLAGRPETTQRSLVPLHVLLELVDEMVDHPVVEVLTTQVGVAEAVEGAPLPLQGVDHVHGGAALPLGVLGVGDDAADHVLKEDLEDAAGLLVDKTGAKTAGVQVKPRQKAPRQTGSLLTPSRALEPPVARTAVTPEPLARGRPPGPKASGNQEQPYTPCATRPPPSQ